MHYNCVTSCTFLALNCMGICDSDIIHIRLVCIPIVAGAYFSISNYSLGATVVLFSSAQQVLISTFKE